MVAIWTRVRLILFHRPAPERTSNENERLWWGVQTIQITSWLSIGLFVCLDWWLLTRIHRMYCERQKITQIQASLAQACRTPQRLSSICRISRCGCPSSRSASFISFLHPANPQVCYSCPLAGRDFVSFPLRIGEIIITCFITDQFLRFTYPVSNSRIASCMLIVIRG